MGTTSKPAPKAKKTTPPATTSEKRTLEPHQVVLSPTAQNAVGIEAWSRFAGGANLSGLVVGLHEAVEKVQGGNVQPVEAMLFGQAMTLQTIFTSLARKAVAQEYLKQFQVNLSLALKAQAQCRATLEALAEIKNPRPVLITKQANITSGHQQVNNGATPDARPVRAGVHAHAEENTSRPNELLERQHGNHLDTSAQGAAGGTNPHLETVDAGYRAAHP